MNFPVCFRREGWAFPLCFCKVIKKGGLRISQFCLPLLSSSYWPGLSFPWTLLPLSYSTQVLLPPLFLQWRALSWKRTLGYSFQEFLETRFLQHWWSYCILVPLHSAKCGQISYRISPSLAHCLPISLPHIAGRTWGWLESCQKPSCISSTISHTEVISHRSCGCQWFAPTFRIWGFTGISSCPCLWVFSSAF